MRYAIYINRQLHKTAEGRDYLPGREAREADARRDCLAITMDALVRGDEVVIKPLDDSQPTPSNPWRRT